MANVFNTHPGLGPITEEEKLEIEDFDAEGEREASVFTLWLNSLDARSVVNSLFDDLSDGGILLQGRTRRRQLSARQPAAGGELMRFKAIENTDYAIEFGKQMRFSLAGVQVAGQRTLRLVW